MTSPSEENDLSHRLWRRFFFFRRHDDLDDPVRDRRHMVTPPGQAVFVSRKARRRLLKVQHRRFEFENRDHPRIVKVAENPLQVVVLRQAMKLVTRMDRHAFLHDFDKWMRRFPWHQIRSARSDG